MKKLVMAMVGLLALALLGTPPLLGNMARDGLQRQLEELSGPQATLSLKSWERGWFSSRGVVTTTFSTSARATLQELDMLAALAEGVDSDIELAHGPVFIGAPSFDDGQLFGLYRFTMTPSKTSWLQDMQTRFGVDQLFITRGETALDGTTRMIATAPAMQASFDELDVDFSGMRQEMKLAGDGSAINYQGSIDHLLLRDADAGTFEISKVQLAGSGRTHEVLTFVGPVSLSVQRVAFREGAAEFSIEEMVLESDATVSATGNTFGGVVRYGAQAINGNELPEIREPNLELSLRNLDMAFYKRYTDLLQSVDPEDEAGQARLLLELEQAVPALLEASPGMTLGPLSVLVDGERLDGMLSLDVDAGAIPAGFSAGDPASLLPALTAVGHLQVPPSMALDMAATQVMEALEMQTSAGLMTEAEAVALAEQQAPLVIEQLQQQGMVRAMPDGTWRVDVELREGNLEVNGQRIPMQALLGP